MEFENLKGWFTNYINFSHELSRKRTKEDLGKIKRLLFDFQFYQERIEEEKINSAPFYNIFYLFNYVIDKEKIIHSPFLADLLNINGSHGQANLFYDEFLKQLKLPEISEKFKVTDKMFLSVVTEKWIGDGFIDIFIEYNSPTRRFAIAIENKIFAKDQPKQLERYAAYLEREFRDNFLLLYLTPDRRLPEMPYSITEERYHQLEKNSLIQAIAYKKHIFLLLENTIEKIIPYKVKSNTEQYFQIIKNNFK
jgi:hypothetical protein